MSQAFASLGHVSRLVGVLACEAVGLCLNPDQGHPVRALCDA